MCCNSTAKQAFHIDCKVEFMSDATGILIISNNAGKIIAERLYKAILITQMLRINSVLSTNA